jgi:hypothetical protein
MVTPPLRSILTIEIRNRCKTNPRDKQKATLKGVLLLSRECCCTYYTLLRIEFQLCKLPGEVVRRIASRGTESKQWRSIAAQ